MTFKSKPTVLTAGLLAGSAILAPGAVASGSPSYRLVGTPIIAGTPSGRGRTSYEIGFRFNRAIPRTSNGRIEAGVSVGTASGGSSLATLGATAHDCFTGAANAKSYATGHRYPFSVTIGPIPLHPTNTLLGKALTVKRYSTLAARQAGLEKALGC
jgi:hypothetical protein